MKAGLAVDLGASYTRIGVGTEHGLLMHEKFPTPRLGAGEELVAEIGRRLRTLVSKALGTRAELLGIGVGSIGPLDLRRGVLSRPANLPYREVPIGPLLEEEFRVPVTVVNDATAGAIGEKHFGAGRGVDNLVYITISTGLGGGVYVDGHVLLGKDGNAGEIGHLVVDAEGRLECGCGGRGHWEAYSSGSGIPRLARLLASEEEGWEALVNVAGGWGGVTAAHVYGLARKGDQFSKKVVEEAGRFNAAGFASVVNAYDPELLVVGGSVALNNPEEVVFQPSRAASRLTINRDPEYRLTSLGDLVVLHGALALALGMESV